MKRVAIAALISVFALGTGAVLAQAPAPDSCAAKAVGSDGKALAGAAKKSFMAKCAREACEPKAVGSDGKPLAGAAKKSFMAKCQKSA
jgi:hypothetical protein